MGANPGLRSPRELAKDLRKRASDQNRVSSQSGYRVVYAGQSCARCCVCAGGRGRRKGTIRMQKGQVGRGVQYQRDATRICRDLWGRCQRQVYSFSLPPAAHIPPPASVPRDICLRIKTECHTLTIEEQCF